MKDTIYREEAINAVLRNLNKEEYRSSWESGAVKVMKDTLEKMPTADRPQGEWIKTTPWSYGAGMGEVYGYYQKCSNCGKEFMYKSNFCPNCGAEMLKGERVND